MKLGVFTALFRDRTFEETCQYLHSLGVQTLELACGGTTGKHHTDPLTIMDHPEKIREMKEIIAKYQLEVAAVSCHGNPVHPDPAVAKSYHDDFMGAIRFAEAMGVDTIVGFSGCPGDSEGSKYPNWVTCAWPNDFGKILEYQWEIIIQYWKETAKRIEDMGANSLCIKDMAGLLTPYKATELVQALREGTDIPIDLHTHYTSGVASMTYLKAVEAGCDIIDTAISPFSMGTAQPATEVMVETFKGTEYDTGLDQKLLKEVADYFKPYREECLANGLLNPKVMGVNINTLIYQVPGGMLSNLVSQLDEMGASDKFDQVLEEVPRVRKDFGEPPLVTPSSQIVGTQAVLNVVMGERYKMINQQAKDLLAGKYGQTVKPFDKEVQKKAIGDEEPITCRPADLLEPSLDKFEKECAQWKQQDEDVLTYALFPQVAKEFFEYREAQQTKVDPSVADKENGAYPV